VKKKFFFIFFFGENFLKKVFPEPLSKILTQKIVREYANDFFMLKFFCFFFFKKRSGVRGGAPRTYFYYKSLCAIIAKGEKK